MHFSLFHNTRSIAFAILDDYDSITWNYTTESSKAITNPSRTFTQMSNPYYGQGQPNGYDPNIHGSRYDPDYTYNNYAPSPEMSNSSTNASVARRYDQDPRTRNDRRKASRYDSSSGSDYSSEEDERPVHRSSKKHRARKEASRSKSSNGLDKAKEHFSTSDRGVGAGMIGAVAGAVIAQETAQRNGKGSIGATIAGLVLGGLAGNALEKGYDK